MDGNLVISIMAKKKRTVGRKPSIGAREPNGRLQRSNEPDMAVLMQRARKAAVTRSHSMEMTPLGILAGHGLIDASMYASAGMYRNLHWQIFGGGPSAALPFLAKLPSDQWPEDIDEAIRIQKLPVRDEGNLKEDYDGLRNRLSYDQQEIVHSLAIHGEWPPSCGPIEHEIVTYRMRWDRDAGLVAGPKPSADLRQAIAFIREAFEALSAQEKTIPVKTTKLDENDIALLTRIAYRQK